MDSPCESINAIVHFYVFKVFMFNRTIFDSNILESTEDYLLKLFKTQHEKYAYYINSVTLDFCSVANQTETL